MHLACLRGEFPRPWTLELSSGLTVIHDRSDGGGSTIRSALNDLVLPGSRVHEADVTGVDGVLVVAGREVPLGELLARVPGLIPVRMPRASALHPPRPTLDHTLEAAVEAAHEAVRTAVEGQRRAEREWQAGRVRWAEALRMGWEERVVAARSMGAARARLAMSAPVAGPAPKGETGRGPLSDAPLKRLARERVTAARAACVAAEAAHAEAEALRRSAGIALADSVAGDEVSGPANAHGPSVERLAAAVAMVEAHPGIDAVEAAQVAVEWERIRALAGGEVDFPSEGEARHRSAQEQVERARRELHAASQSSSGFDRADVEVLEATHAEVLAAWAAGEGTAGGRARLRLDEARAAEQAVLARMGLASYADYMAASADQHGPDTPGVEAARRRLVACQDALAEIETDVSALAEHSGAAFSATLGALRARAAELLGEDPGDDVAKVLRERITSDPLPDLLVAMAEVGVPVDRPATRAQVVSRARRWIDHGDPEASVGQWHGLGPGSGGSVTEPRHGPMLPAESAERLERDRAAVVSARAELAEAEAARKDLASRRPLPVRRRRRDGTRDPGRLDLESRAARVTFEAARIGAEPVDESGESDRARGRAAARAAPRPDRAGRPRGVARGAGPLRPGADDRVPRRGDLAISGCPGCRCR